MIVSGPWLHEWIQPRVPLARSLDNRYIGWQEHGKLSAVVMFSDFHGKTCQIHVAAEGKQWMRKEFLWYTFYYPFVECDYYWLASPIRAKNLQALRLNTNLGFEEFASLKDGYAMGEDIILQRVHRDNPRVQKWLSLGERYGKGLTAATA